MRNFPDLAVNQLDEFVYGRAPHPVTTRSGLVIGGGTVYPEINFTLLRMEICSDTLPEVRSQYTELIEGVCRRAVELGVPGLVVEFELLPPDARPENAWGKLRPLRLSAPAFPGHPHSFTLIGQTERHIP